MLGARIGKRRYFNLFCFEIFLFDRVGGGGSGGDKVLLPTLNNQTLGGIDL